MMLDAGNRMTNRTALLIRCSKREVEAMRAEAKVEGRTINNFVLRIVSRALEFEECLEGRYLISPSFRAQSRAFHTEPERKVGPRTAILVRCSIEEAERIREAARRRQIRISEYVLQCVRRAMQADTFVAPRRSLALARLPIGSEAVVNGNSEE